MTVINKKEGVGNATAGVGDMLAFKSGLAEVEEDEIKKPEKPAEEPTKEEDIPATKENDKAGEDEIEDETEPEDDEISGGIDYKKLWEKAEAEKDTLLKAVVEKPAAGQQQPEQPTTQKPAAALTFITGEEIPEEGLYELTTNKDSLVKFLNDFGNKVRVKTAEEILQTVPGIAQNVAGFTVTLNEMNRQFFQDHPELAPIKRLVSATADELIKERGVNDLSGYEKILKDLPKVMEERFDLGKIGKPLKSKKAPKLAKPGGGRPPRAADKDEGLTPLQKDIKAALEYSKKHGRV